MPRRHRQEDILYWNAAESDSDESLGEYHPLPPPAKEPYIDPWDLENYAYIREHLDSMELSSNPSLPQSGSISMDSGKDFAETNSNSFFYVPGHRRPSTRHNDVNGDYADIEEVHYVSRRPIIDERRNSHYDYNDEDSPYENGLKENSVFGIYDQAGRFRKVAVPVDTAYKTELDRSLSSPYGDYDYDPYTTRHEIYSKLDEMPRPADRTMPIYDDVRRLRRKPHNFGLTNYGHLKIDYSLSWNNLNKYIRYHS